VKGHKRNDSADAGSRNRGPAWSRKSGDLPESVKKDKKNPVRGGAADGEVKTEEGIETDGWWT